MFLICAVCRISRQKLGIGAHGINAISNRLKEAAHDPKYILPKTGCEGRTDFKESE